MSRLWLDTAVWYAALDPREEWHALAVECWRAAMADGVRLHTSELVLAETHALVSRRLSPSAGAALLEAVERDPAIDVHEIGAALRREARLNWLARFRDQRFSLTDAVSFEWMKRLGIRRALTFDQHFVVAGFGVVPPRPATS